MVMTFTEAQKKTRLTTKSGLFEASSYTCIASYKQVFPVLVLIWVFYEGSQHAGLKSIH